MIKSLSKRQVIFGILAVSMVVAFAMIPKIRENGSFKIVEVRPSNEKDGSQQTENDEGSADYSTIPKTVVTSDDAEVQDIDLVKEIIVKADPVDVNPTHDNQNKKNVPKIDDVIAEELNLI